MKGFIVFLALIASVYCDWCTYQATDGSYYQFYNMQLNGTGASGNLWLFDVCDVEESDYVCDNSVDSLGKNVAVCIQKGDTYYSRGFADSGIWSDSPLGTDKGAEVIFSTETFKTVITLVCSDNVEPIVTITEEADTYTSITVNGSVACPLAPLDGSGDYPQVTSVTYERQIYIPFPFLLLPVALLSACVCMCCTCLRRRRCQQKRAAAMAQISNQVFQPISHDRSQVALNMPNPQSQFVYYYPMTNMNPQVQQQTPPLVPLDAEPAQVSDEAFAKELQAQYDREARL